MSENGTLGWGQLNVLMPRRQTDWSESWLSPLPASSLGTFLHLHAGHNVYLTEEVIRPTCGYRTGFTIVIITIINSSGSGRGWPIRGRQETPSLFTFTHGNKRCSFTKWFKFTSEAVCLQSCPDIPCGPPASESGAHPGAW